MEPPSEEPSTWIGPNPSLSICGNPEDCLAQALAAKAAGAKRLMLTVSLASDPVRTVELFGEHVLPKL